MIYFFLIVLAIVAYVLINKNIDKTYQEAKENYRVKSNGYYVCKHSGLSQFDRKQAVCYFILFFSEKGTVCLFLPENLEEWKKNNPYNELKEFISEINNINEESYRNDITSYRVSGGKILMRFSHIKEIKGENNVIYSQDTYDEYEGVVIKNGLILSLHRKLIDYNEGKGGYRKPTILRDLKFDFVEI